MRDNEYLGIALLNLISACLILSLPNVDALGWFLVGLAIMSAIYQLTAYLFSDSQSLKQRKQKGGRVKNGSS